jgi:arginine:agmatine antiporter
MFLVAGTMIGSGVFLLPASAATIGTIATFGWGIAAAGALLVALSLGLLARKTDSGGYVEGIGRYLGPTAALVAAILYALGVLLSILAVALALAGYLAFFLPALSAPAASSAVAVGATLLFLLLNHLGAGLVARFGTAMLAFGLLPLLLVGTLGWSRFDPAIFAAGWNRTGASDAAALFQGTLLVFWAYLGLEAASVVSRQMANPARDVPVATVGGVLLATLVYVSASAAIAGMIPAEQLAASTAPFADATALLLGGAAAALVAMAALLKVAGTLGAMVLCTVESWISVEKTMGRRGLSRPAILTVIAGLTALLAMATANPSLAEQFGVIISAVVALCLLVFALAGLALARASGSLGRATGLAAALFCLALLALQPAAILLPAGATLATVTLMAVFVRQAASRRRGAA